MEGNQVKMREALNVVHRIAATAKSDFDVFAGIERIRRISMSALSAPPRNCDVGTAEEQVARHHLFCNAMMKKNNHCCGPCPCYKFVNGEAQSCTLLWAQMPCEEGGRRREVKTLFECDKENAQLAEKGIEFVCPNRHCPLHILCPYAARTNEEGGAK